MIFDARPAAQGPNKMNNSNYESNKFVSNFPGFQGLGGCPPHGGHMIYVAGLGGPGSQ